MIKLLLVDDEPAVLKGLQMCFAAEPDITVIGEAADGETALALTPTLLPDIVLMDFQLPRMDGVATTKAIRALCPNVSVIMLTIHDSAVVHASAMGAGVSAFITKHASMKELLATIRQVAGK